MKNAIFRMAVLIPFLLSMLSCIKDPEYTPADIKVGTKLVEFGKDKSDAVVKILSNRDWKAELASTEGTPEWIKLSTMEGSASKDSVNLVLSVLPNEGEDRYATLKIKTATVYESVTVFQKGAVEKQYTPIKDVRAMFKGSNIKIGEGVLIKGTVISNCRRDDKGGLNNATSAKTVVIADAEAGISLYMTEDNATLAPGDVVEVRLDGLELQRFGGGSLQVDKVPIGNVITLMPGGPMPEPLQITAAQLCTGEYESRYVAVSDVQVAESDMGKTFVMNESHTSINFVSSAGEKFVIFSSKYSTYGDVEVPSGSGVLKGIAMVYGGSTYQISITSVADYAGLKGDRF